MPGQNDHTVKDKTIPWLYPATKGLDLAPLKEGVVRVCGSRVRPREGVNQVDLRWPISLFHSIFVCHYNNACVPTVLWIARRGFVCERESGVKKGNVHL